MAAGLLFTMVFFVRPPFLYSSTASLSHTQIIMFSDLECDYINPIDLCNKLNQVRSPINSFGHSTLPNKNKKFHVHVLVRPTRKHRPCIPNRPLPPLWTMDRVPLELAARLV